MPLKKIFFLSIVLFQTLPVLAQIPQRPRGLPAAARQDHWSIFADRTAAEANLSPVTDEARTKTPVIARFIRLTITATMDLPESADPNDPVNAKNAWSIFELKVFGK